MTVAAQPASGDYDVIEETRRGTASGTCFVPSPNARVVAA